MAATEAHWNYEWDVENQSVEVEPGVRVSKMVHDLGGKFIEYMYEDVRSLYDAFQRGLKISANDPCLGTRSGKNLEYQWMTYNEVFEQAKQIGSAILHEGIPSGSNIGLFVGNRKEWVITDQACHAYSFVPVPIYGTYGMEAAHYMIKQTKMSVILTDTVAKAKEILAKAADLPFLKVLIVTDMTPGQEVEGANKTKAKIVSFTEMLEIGKENIRPVKPNTSTEGIASICYTSGSTGNPKGVIFTNKSMICDISAVLVHNKFHIQKDHVHLSYLPGAHVFERLLQVAFFQQGAKVGFFRGDARLLMEDIAALKPTMFPMVPRVLNRIFDKFMIKVNSSPAIKSLYEACLQEKTTLLKQGKYSRETEADKKLFGGVQAMLGGAVKMSLVGAAPVSEEVLTFGRCALGIPLPEAYGQSENTGGCNLTVPTEYRAGHVGPPIPCNYIKLVDVEEMGIVVVRDKKGEICIKGSNVMPGYYLDPERTKEAIDKDGWLHTGDIGLWTEWGSLKIVDRRKHLFKLSQGEYIAPEQLEVVYARCSLIMQIFVDGSSLRDYTVAIVVPDPEVLPALAEKQGITGTFPELCQNKEIKKVIFDQMAELGKEANLKRFEQVKKIHLCSTPFSLEEGLLTPTMKACRGKLRAHFKAEVDAMYEN